MDNSYFASNSLFDTASSFAGQGGKVLYIDEVHKYQEWSREIKMMYDYLSELKVVVTGSSIMEIVKDSGRECSAAS